MLLRWCSHVARATLLLAGLIAWASLSLRGTAAWICLEAKGRWFQGLHDIPVQEIAIVPGSGFHHGRPNPGMAERLRLGLALYRAGRVRTVLVSGDDRGLEVAGMRTWLVAHGVPADRIVSDPMGVRTLETMTRAARIFGVRQAVICTQSWAAPRALFLARAAGMDAIAYVPQMDRHRNDLLARENLKMTLAFVERYLLGRTGSSPPQRDAWVSAASGSDEPTPGAL